MSDKQHEWEDQEAQEELKNAGREHEADLIETDKK